MGRWVDFLIAAAFMVSAASVWGQSVTTSPQTLEVNWRSSNATTASENRSSGLSFTTPRDNATSRGEDWFDPATMMRAPLRGHWLLDPWAIDSLFQVMILAAQRQGDETDHLVQGHSPLHLKVLPGAIHAPVHLLVRQPEHQGLVAGEVHPHLAVVLPALQG